MFWVHFFSEGASDPISAIGDSFVDINPTKQACDYLFLVWVLTQPNERRFQGAIRDPGPDGRILQKPSSS